MPKAIPEDMISLRPLTSDDLEYFYLWASDPEVAKSMTWEAYTSRVGAEKFLKEIAENHPWFKAICLDGIPIGSITLRQEKGCSSCHAELGYVLAKAYWSKNITTAAVKLAISNRFNDLKINRIEAFVENHTIFKGKLRDSYLYSISKL